MNKKIIILFLSLNIFFQVKSSQNDQKNITYATYPETELERKRAIQKKNLLNKSKTYYHYNRGTYARI
jgi:carbonic anhydrase